MAKLEAIAVTGMEDQLEKLGNGMRAAIRDAVMAGAQVYAQELQGAIRDRRHVETGAMLQSVAPGPYHETLGGGEVYIYPQGTDNRGVRNAMKAYVISRGYGGKRTAKTGDKFVAEVERVSETQVQAAIQASLDAAISKLSEG